MTKVSVPSGLFIQYFEFAGVTIVPKPLENIRKALFLHLTVTNHTKKRIKYFEIDLYAKNTFGDPVDTNGNPGGKPQTFTITDIGADTGSWLDNKKKAMQSTRPIWSNASRNIDGLIVSRVKITWIDGTVDEEKTNIKITSMDKL